MYIRGRGAMGKGGASVGGEGDVHKGAMGKGGVSVGGEGDVHKG